jgi:hypothetical protein
MINKVAELERTDYYEFNGLLRSRIHATLDDKDSKTNQYLNFTKASYPWNNWSVIKDANDEMEYFLMHDPLFKSIIHDDLIEEASKNYPDYFGTNEPEKVLEALSLTIGINHDSSKIDHYRQNSYVAIIDKQKEKVLYLGLFRTFGNIKSKKEEEFKSGYLHCLKHFYGSDKQPITSNSEPNILPENFIEHIIRCLFEGNHANEKDVEIPNDKYYTYKYPIDEKEYQFGFYYSAKFDIFFLSDARRKGK